MSRRISVVDLVRLQLVRYAEDLAQTYRVERTRTRELEKTNRELVATRSQLQGVVGRLEETNRQLQSAYLDSIHRLAVASEYRDDDTGDHILRMSHYAAHLARLAGLPSSEVKGILHAAPMHDVGKIGVPDAILLKPGRLTHAEFETMKNHTIIGGMILDNPPGDVLRMARIIALSHHERWDGSGYPYGLAGNEIPVAGQIAAVADVFDALTTKRPYKEAFSRDKALGILLEGRNTHFRPDLVDLFVAHVDDFESIRSGIDQNPELSLSEFEPGAL